MKTKWLASFTALVLCAFSLGYSDGENVSITSEYIDYHMGGDRYTVIAVQKEGMSESEAKDKALKRAAELAVENGYSYFKVESEKEVMVYQTKPNWPSNSDFPGNLYQEDIRENDSFDRDRLLQEQQTPGSGTQPKPGVQLVIQGYKTKPSGKSLNPCDYTECK